MKKLPPCKKDGVDCPNRKPACGATCKEYKDWKAEFQAEKRELYKDRPADRFAIETAVKIRKKSNRKK